MWIFTQDGFLSIVQDTQHQGNLLVRARKRDDLRRFVQLAQANMQMKVPVLETPTHDYRFRITVPHVVAVYVIQELVVDIDYSNFKNRVHDVDPDPRRSIAYTRVWTEMVQFQEDTHAPPPELSNSKEYRAWGWYGDQPIKPKKEEKKSGKASQKQNRRR